MRNSIWFLLAAVVSLHGLAFAEDDNNEPAGTEVVLQEDRQEQAPVSESKG